MAKFPWKAVAVGGVAAAAVGGLVLATRSDAPTAPKRVALIGDSYAVGLGPELAKLIPDFKYEGHVGTNTWQWASNASQWCGQCGSWLSTFKPDVVLVSLGTNDGNAPNPTNYQKIVQMIHGIGARAVWIAPPAPVQTASRAVIASLGVPVIPATTTPLAGDGMHPRNYAQWAFEIARALGYA